jgi:hypothetical protein
VVDNTSSINALGYNLYDGYLYAAMGAAPSRLIRISTVDGSYTDLGSLNLNSTAVAGVVDEAGQYWLTNAANTAWTQVNLVPGASTFAPSTYGKVVASGTSVGPAYPVSDWAYVPVYGGNALWGLGYNAGLLGTATTYLMQWSRATKVWSTSSLFLNVVPLLTGNTANWQSVFADQSGLLYGTDSATGQLFSFAMPGDGLGLLASYIATDAGAAVADAARCVTA